MLGAARRSRIGIGRLIPIVLLAGCVTKTSVEDLAEVQTTLSAAGKRLSASLSAGALTSLSSRGDRVLAALNRAERDALARGELRFRLDRPALINVVAPETSVPYWLADQGFARTHLQVNDGDIAYVVYRKSFGPGAVGLGVNGLDRASPAHYAVFLRASDGNELIPCFVGTTEHWRATTAALGVSLTHDVARPIARLSEELRGATLLQPAHDRRHNALLVQGKAWKTHVPSTRTPDQVIISFGNDPATELVWGWRTAPEVAGSVVKLRTKRSSPDERIVTGTSSVLSTRDVLNDPQTRRHSVHVHGLESDTIYEYSVGDGTERGMSPWKTVRTGPRSGGDFALMYLGDPQCGLERWGKLLADAHKRRPDVGAILIAGDLVDRGNERTNWDHFFLRAAGVFARVPVMPSVGNHEYLDQGPRLFRTFFDLPQNGPYDIDTDLVYRFEYADAFVAVLDSTLAVSDSSMARKQAEWLDAALANTRRTWKLVMFHHPVYASHPTRENPGLRDAWVPVFDRHHVDLVLQGHDHAYLRTYPMRGNQRVASAREGTVYIVSVSGDKYYDQNPRDHTEVGFTHVSTYQTIDINAHHNQLLYRSWDESGREVDRFAIEKPASVVDMADRMRSSVGR